MINNLYLLNPLLNFKEEGDFFRILILKRKKDQSTEKSNHQSSRIVKTYSIYSIEQLESKMDEIIKLCELFKARAYITVGRLNDKDVSLMMMRALADKIYSKQNNNEFLYDSVVGSLKSKDKRWVVDIDSDDLAYTDSIIEELKSLPPFGRKIIAKIPTKSGVHLITNPFRRDFFVKWYTVLGLNIDVQTNHLTILYIPDSIL